MPRVDIKKCQVVARVLHVLKEKVATLSVHALWWYVMMYTPRVGRPGYWGTLYSWMASYSMYQVHI